MVLMPSAGSFTMWAIPREVSCISAHKTLTFLLLVMIHGLCHLEGQSLYVVWFGWGALHRIRVRWEQICHNSSHTSHGGQNTSCNPYGGHELKVLLWSCCVGGVAFQVSWPDDRECQSWCLLVPSQADWPWQSSAHPSSWGVSP